MACSHSLALTVAIDPDQADAAQVILNEQVVPWVAEASGFVTGHWAQRDDNAAGLSMVTMQSVEVRAVVAHA